VTEELPEQQNTAVRIEPIVGIDQINDNHYLAYVMLNSGEEGAEDIRRDVALYVRIETGEWMLQFLEGWNGYPQVIIAELAAAFARFSVTT
jgi:hypothetical protein